MTVTNFPSSFKPISQESPNFPSSFKPIENQKKQEPLTLRGAATSYGSGVAGGAGGIIPDLSPLLGAVGSQLPDLVGAKGTHELTASVAKQLGGQEPQNAAERILQQAGEFGGLEGLIGTGIGGPAGGALGLAHGSVSGTLYGSLKELGVPDEWALISTAVATLSPVAAERLLTTLKSNKSLKSALKAVEADVTTPPPPPPGSSPAISPKTATQSIETPAQPKGIGPGSEIPEVANAFPEKEKLIKDLGKLPEFPSLGLQVPVETSKIGKSLKGRISKESPLGNSVSKEAFDTEAQAGRDISNEIKELYKQARKDVNVAYRKSDEVTKNHNDVFPELANKNEDRIRALEDIEKRSASQEAIYQDRLAIRRLIGENNGLIEQNAYKLLKQADSFSQKVNYEIPYAGSKGEIKELVNSIKNSVIDSLLKAGKNIEPVVKADNTYRLMADRFMGDKISPFLQRKILNPERLATSSIEDIDTYRAVKNAIGSSKGDIVKKIDRELVERRMKKFFENPELVNSEEYVKELKNLNQLIGKEKTAEVDYLLRQRSKKFASEKEFQKAREIRQNAPKKGAPEPIKNKVTKEVPYKTPEEIDSAFRTRSGVRRLKRELSHADFEKLSKQEVEKIFREGKFGSKTLTGEDIIRIVDKNHEVLVELMGQEAVSDLYKISKVSHNSELSNDKVRDIAKKLGKISLSSVGLGKWLSFIL